MTKQQAHDLLNLVKIGFSIPAWRVNQALTVTGDLNARRVGRPLRNFGNDQGLAGVHAPSGEGTGLKRDVEGFTTHGQGAH